MLNLNERRHFFNKVLVFTNLENEFIRGSYSRILFFTSLL
ncbi:hypothetical protein SAMN04487979_12431 [Flavobacterium sp. ov086]|nr:hypothetical protein SAMN04487979_12431 [Flavobacterium sp. ov086]